MAQGLNDSILTAFKISKPDMRTYSPLTLAYIGDAVFEVIIRSAVVGDGNAPANTLHQHTSHLVKASTQARLLDLIQDDLTEEERDVVRRGRNSHPNSKARNTSMHEYLEATGFEALIGWLYLTDQMDRAIDLSCSAVMRFEPKDRRG